MRDVLEAEDDLLDALKRDVRGADRLAIVRFGTAPRHGELAVAESGVWREGGGKKDHG
jgi:hypothetical protein